MCGIVGIAGDITVDLKKTFHQLLIVDQLRGTHSTGVLSVMNATDKTKIAKVLGGPENLEDSKAFNDLFTDYNKVLLGHNRWATQGKIIARNAHPFDFDTVVGVHNGSLRNYHQLPDANKFSVDSEALYHGINELGIDRAIAKVTGAYALVWWDKLTNSIYFLRNTERPLYIAMTENKRSLVWASEKWMLEGVAGRNNIKLGEVFLLNHDTLVSCEIPTVKADLKLHVRPNVKGGTEVYSAPVLPFRQGSSASSTVSSNQGASSSTTTTVGGGEANTKAAAANEEVVKADESALKLRQVLFTCGIKGCDQFGAKYVNVSRADDNRAYRLYLNRDDFGKFHSGDEIMADVTSLKVENMKIIYKLLSISVTNVTTLKREKAERLAAKTDEAVQVETKREMSLDKLAALLDSPEEAQEEPTYNDSHGKPLNKAAFVKMYGFCANCTGNVDPEEGYRFIGHEVLCDTCASDRVIVDALTN